MNVLKKIETTDILQFLGLVLIGTGLFFLYGKGVALAVVGALLIFMGFFGGAISAKATKVKK